MQIAKTIPTTFGRRLLPPEPMIRLSLTPNEVRALRRSVERDVMIAEQEGNFKAADRLGGQAAAPRESAR